MPRVRQDVELPEGGGERVRELRVADLRVEDPDTRRVRVQQPLCLGVPRQQLSGSRRHVRCAECAATESKTSIDRETKRQTASEQTI